MTYYKIIGIDPGQSGAIICISNTGELVSLQDIPTITIRKGKKNKDIYYDIAAIIKLLRNFTGIVYLEKTQPMAAPVRAQANYGLGFCSGMLEGMLAALQIPYELIHPKTWHKYFNMTKAKGDYKKQAYMIAQKLFPTGEFKGPRGGIKDGRSDAALIAEWGRRHLQEGS
jgi:hypothetical protein